MVQNIGFVRLFQGLESLDIDPNNIVGRGYPREQYSLLKRLDEAIAMYQQAVKHNPGNEDLRTYRYGLAFLQGDAAEMQLQMNWAPNKSSVEECFPFLAI